MIIIVYAEAIYRAVINIVSGMVINMGLLFWDDLWYIDVMDMVGVDNLEYIQWRIRMCDYLVVAQLFLQDNFLLERELRFEDIKPRLLGHWGTCHGINVAYANLKTRFLDDGDFAFILGPGHGFPALNANLWLDGKLEEVDKNATRDLAGLKYVCKNFSWPDGFPSHASPMTPGVITEGGELGYALANAYGMSLGHPEKTIAVLIGDGELETATALDSLNLRNLLAGNKNGQVLPILHLNGYKISAPSIYARKSERELNELIRGFGFTPIAIRDNETEKFQEALDVAVDAPFIILITEKGEGGPNRHHESHQIPLKYPKADQDELKRLEDWLRSYRPDELFSIIFDKEKTIKDNGGPKSNVDQEKLEENSVTPDDLSRSEDVELANYDTNKSDEALNYDTQSDGTTTEASSNTQVDEGSNQ